MPKRIAVEEGLTPVREYLQENGYDVVDLNERVQAEDCDCCIVSGGDVNVMGMQDIVTDVPVIDARGMTSEEVYQKVQERIGY